MTLIRESTRNRLIIVDVIIARIKPVISIPAIAEIKSAKMNVSANAVLFISTN